MHHHPKRKGFDMHSSGRPSASHYFVATQANSFFYLDPHSTRPGLPYRAHTHPQAAASTALASSTTSTSSSTTVIPSPNEAVYSNQASGKSPYSLDEISSCHTRRIRRLQIREMDPSMLLAFLITSRDDYNAWKEGVRSVQGKSVVHIQDQEPPPRGQERAGAVDEVESWDEEGL